MSALGDWRLWGKESVRLRLPHCVVEIAGVSRSQRDAIEQAYSAFVLRESERQARVDVFCEARRLAAPLTVPPQELTAAGQYAPRQVRQDDCVQVTGIDFTARIPLVSGAQGSGPAVARVCVAREEELSQPIVLENVLRILLAHRAIGFGGMLLHSAGVVIDGRAFLFVGRSNAGKTTLSRKADAKGLSVLSDDINLVLPCAGGFAVHAVPFTGEFRRRVEVGPGASPLAGLLLLEKGARLELARVGAAAAVSALFAQSPFVNTGIEQASGLLESLAGVVAKVPVARLTVALESRFSEVMKAVEEHFSYV